MRRHFSTLKNASVAFLVACTTSAAHAEGTASTPRAAAQTPTNAPTPTEAATAPPPAATTVPQTAVAAPNSVPAEPAASTANSPAAAPVAAAPVAAAPVAAAPVAVAPAVPAGTPAAVTARPSVPSSTAPVPLEQSFVHLGSSYARAQLELKNSVDDSEWRAVCLAPCDTYVKVTGTLARVTAPGMTSSNAFRIAPGTGTALVRVDGGSSRARSFGILGLSVGIPTSVAGMALFSYGKFADKDGMRISGAAVLATGVVIVAVSLPLLLIGKTAVRDGNGTVIAKRLASGHFAF
jgi:hypothetical protein